MSSNAEKHFAIVGTNNVFDFLFLWLLGPKNWVFWSFLAKWGLNKLFLAQTSMPSNVSRAALPIGGKIILTLKTIWR